MYFLLERAGMSRGPASVAGMIVCAALRFAALWWGLKLPVFRLREDLEDEG